MHEVASAATGETVAHGRYARFRRRKHLGKLGENNTAFNVRNPRFNDFVFYRERDEKSKSVFVRHAFAFHSEPGYFKRRGIALFV
jgi:hypothetical protein